jgi:hypothetical protein
MGFEQIAPIFVMSPGRWSTCSPTQATPGMMGWVSGSISERSRRRYRAVWDASLVTAEPVLPSGTVTFLFTDIGGVDAFVGGASGGDERRVGAAR